MANVFIGGIGSARRKKDKMQTWPEFRDDMYAWYKKEHPNSGRPKENVVYAMYEQYKKEFQK